MFADKMGIKLNGSWLDCLLIRSLCILSLVNAMLSLSAI
jgi:hypothetical protein